MRISIFRELPEEPPDYREWKPWFAWYPVFIDGLLVWLETVDRRPAGLYPPTFVAPHDHRVRG